MSTLLLVSGETEPEQPSGTERSATRRGQTLKGALERAGYEVVQAEDAATALTRLGEGPPDLIVLAGSRPGHGAPRVSARYCAATPPRRRSRSCSSRRRRLERGARPRARARISCSRPRSARPRSPTGCADCSRRRGGAAPLPSQRGARRRRARIPPVTAALYLAPGAALPWQDAHATHSARTMSVQRALAWSPRRFRCASSRRDRRVRIHSRHAEPIVAQAGGRPGVERPPEPAGQRDREPALPAGHDPRRQVAEREALEEDLRRHAPHPLRRRGATRRTP